MATEKKKDKSGIDKARFLQRVRAACRSQFRKDLQDASDEERYHAVAAVVKDDLTDDWIDTHRKMRAGNYKKLYYLSMEFLEGRALGNNLINMCREKPVREALEEIGIDLNALEKEERDPGLGNGGLGRLAACFLDSLSTLGYPAYGCGIRYRYGLFRQKIVNGEQKELPDLWLKNGSYPFEIRRNEYTTEIRFGGTVETVWDEKKGRNFYKLKDYKAVLAVPYDIPIVGYGNGVVNSLRVWDAQPLDVFRLDEFDKGDYLKAIEQAELAKTITDVLYPNDNHRQGKQLRLIQQYFFVSASVQTALKKFSEINDDIHDLPEKVVFHMNDTHPSLTVVELMRILLDEYMLEWDDAWDLTTRTCAFTNHTIMQEALEKWPEDLFQLLLPRIWQIVCEVSHRLSAKIEKLYPGNFDKHRNMDIIYAGNVRMAFLAIEGSFSVNGVAAIHTEILKKEVFKDFYELYPEKFNNKTNGITQRRFLLKADPGLSALLTELLGDGWITDLSLLKGLEAFADDEKVQERFFRIKRENKLRLIDFIKENGGPEVDPDSIFDVQVKRLHEYKRQLLNVLHIMYQYDRLKSDPDFDMQPHTYIFGAKAAAGYRMAKLIIRLINAVASVINADKSIGGKIRVVFIEDYNVSAAELIFPAADISEQISTASKEASGTSNMKFMLNGALTLGTMDGANIEIVEEVGKENAFIFGMSAEEVIEHEKKGDYNPNMLLDQDPELRHILMQLVNGFYSPDDPELFREIFEALCDDDKYYGWADRYFVLKDFRDYVRAHEEAEKKYRDKAAWAKSALLNIANSGKFSSDRTIGDYNRDVRHLEKLK